jgi:hypothetical protein
VPFFDHLSWARKKGDEEIINKHLDSLMTHIKVRRPHKKGGFGLNRKFQFNQLLSAFICFQPPFSELFAATIH